MSPLALSIATLLGCVLTAVILVPLHRRSLEVPGRKETDIFLLKSPNNFSVTDVLYLVFRIVLKYLYAFLGLSAPLRPSTSILQAFEFTPIRVHGTLSITQADIDRFNLAVEASTPKSTIHQLHPLLLPALTGPLAVYILALDSCPIRPLGAVNTRNRITAHSTICQDGEALLAASRGKQLSYAAIFGFDPGRRVKRGVEFAISVDIYLQNSDDQSKECIMTQTLHFLQFLPSTSLPHFTQPMSETFAVPDMTSSSLPQTEIRVNQAAPRKWAACNKDFNPIHISTIGAKLFGQKSVIAHGMHVVALALETLKANGQHDMPMARRVCWGNIPAGESWTVDMRFVRPINLPSTVALRCIPTNASTAELGLLQNDKVATWIGLSLEADSTGRLEPDDTA